MNRGDFMKTSSLGYLLNLLDISPSKLSKFINVDRSLVSKWKNGSRKIDMRNEYVDKVLDFMIMESKNSCTNKIEAFLASIYPDYTIQEAANDDYIKSYLIKFITSNEFNLGIAHSTFNTSSDSTIFSYTANVPIIQGEENKRATILYLLDVALKENTPKKLTFIFSGVLDTLMDCYDFRQAWLKKVLLLLDRGFKLDLLCASYNNTKLFSYFLPLILHNHCCIRTFTYSLLESSTFSIHIIENQMVLLTFTQLTAHPPYSYGSLYTDPISIELYTNIVKNILKFSEAIFTSHSSKEILERFLITHPTIFPTTLSLYNKIYYYTSIPYPFFMEAGLYEEVLKSCHYLDKQIKDYMNIYKSVQRHLTCQLNAEHIVHFYPLDYLMAMAQQPFIHYPSCDTSVMPELTLTNKQYKKHLQNITDYLTRYSKLSICLDSSLLFTSSADLCYYCKKDEFLVINYSNMQKQFKLCMNVPFINSISNLFTKQLLYTEDKLKDKESVTNILLGL